MAEQERARIICEPSETPDTFGSFVVEPLERGFGTTLGNALRRILLSTLPGAAVVSLRIDGVLHEFSTIPGVVEDLTQIVLNIKEMAVRLNADGPKSLVLNAKGPGILKAGDFAVDADVEITNPDLHIATLTDEAKVTIELVVDHGRGYVSADKNKRPGMAIGVIPVDSIFTPVKRVNPVIENTRVGQMTDFDKLTLDVWTNGALTPAEATKLAAQILVEQLGLFINLQADGEGGYISAMPATKGFEHPIEDLELSVRSYNSLKRAGINTIEDLTSKSRGEMMKVRNLGEKSLEEVIQRLSEKGINLRDDESANA